MQKYLILFLCFLSSGSAQTKPAAPVYEPTEIQRLRLENAQLRVQLIGTAIQPLQQRYQEQLMILAKLCEEVRKENKWPQDIECDVRTLQFVPRPKPEATPIPVPPPVAPTPVPTPAGGHAKKGD